MAKGKKRIVAASGDAEPTVGGKLHEILDELVTPEICGYQKLNIIGEGGMGSVFSAERESDGKEVAIKVIRSDLDCSIYTPFFRRFQREIEVSKYFAHPYLVKILDGGKLDDGNPYLVMEYLEGESLEERSARHALTASECERILEHMIEAMSVYSEQGLIHRDIKPSNIYLEESGRTVLLDFGLVKATDLTQLTETGDRLGTFCAMAPEQLMASDVDIRADIYGLGVALYVAATQEKPRSHDDTIRLAMGAPPPLPKAPHKVRKGFSKDLSQLIMRCLQYDAAKRFQNVQELQQAFKELQKEDFLTHTEAVAQTLVEAPVPLQGSDTKPTVSKRTKEANTRKALLLVPLLLLLLACLCWPKGDKKPVAESPQSLARDVTVLRDELLKSSKVPTCEECDVLGALLLKIGIQRRLALSDNAPTGAISLLYLARAASKRRAANSQLFYLTLVEREAEYFFGSEGEVLRDEVFSTLNTMKSRKALIKTVKTYISTKDDEQRDRARCFLARVILKNFDDEFGLDSDVWPNDSLKEARQLLKPLFGTQGRWCSKHKEAHLYLKVLERFSTYEDKIEALVEFEHIISVAKATEDTAQLYLQGAFNLLRRHPEGRKTPDELLHKVINLLQRGLEISRDTERRFIMMKLLADRFIRFNNLAAAEKVINQISLEGIAKNKHWTLDELKGELEVLKGNPRLAIDYLHKAVELAPDEKNKTSMRKKRDRLRLRYHSAGGAGS